MFKLAYVVFIGFVISACVSTSNVPTEQKDVCDKKIFESIEHRIKTSDSTGHGPDIGSDEWQSVVEFKLSVRGELFVPSRETGAWCQFIEMQLSKEGL